MDFNNSVTYIVKNNEVLGVQPLKILTTKSFLLSEVSLKDVYHSRSSLLLHSLSNSCFHSGLNVLFSQMIDTISA